MSKMTKILISVGVLFGMSLIINGSSYGYMQPTHRLLNGGIVSEGYGLPLDDYLRESLNFEFGTSQPITKDHTKYSVIDWIKLGGEQEDVPNLKRNMHHFHDPLVEDWNFAGFKGIGISSVVWAQFPYQDFATGTGNYSWQDARGYFYKALTATDETTRNSNFADCFRGLGQQMHLVQDASVPSHSRNDFHWYYHFEHWVNDNQELVQEIINTPSAIPTVSAFLTSRKYYNPEAKVPIAGLFDTDRYDGNNADITMSGDIGLSEYTNANFLSLDTIFQGYGAPYRDKDKMEDLWITNPRDPSQAVYRPYYMKSGDGDSGYPLGAVTFLQYYSIKYVPWLDVSGIDRTICASLDAYCYKEYAKRLIPKAVAYAAEIPRYFFRGQVDAVEAKTTTNDEGDISGMTLKVKNETPGETMWVYNGLNPNSKLAVSYCYSISGKTGKEYGCSDEITLRSNISPNNDTSKEVYEYEFPFDNPIPADAKNISYMLVYRGKLGVEEDAVAAKSFNSKSGAIDDWENGQNWVTQNKATTLSLENDPALVFEKASSLKIALANDYAETYYGQIYYNTAWDVGQDRGVKAMGQAGLTFSSPTTLTRVSFYVIPGWNTNNLNDDTVVRIYGNVGEYPGELIAESEHVVITPDNMGLLWYKFEPALELPIDDYSSFNITFEPVGGTGAPLLVCLYTRGGYYFQGNQIRKLSSGWTADAEYDMTILWATEAPPLASLEKSVDLSGKNGLSIAVWSTTLKDNVLNLQYGTDKDHVKTVPIEITQNEDYQTFKTPLSGTTDKGESMDLADIGYFAITLGKDGCEDDGKYKENTIYVDLLDSY